MRSIGIPELIVVLLVGVIFVLVPIGVIVAVVSRAKRGNQPFASKTCTHCGQRIPDLGTFCPFCGQKL